ncbi:unnamed protein product [Anisakis simplex]|uniref:Phosphoglycerate mutase n=1 Tax=Anisakis simplex TaxID=6269 RepID=A0A0M3JE37_ANISI|nr:unnamed protein product [Anisakis simplex]
MVSILEAVSVSGSLLVVTHGAVVGAIHEIVTGKWSSVGQATVSKFTRFRSEQGFVCEYSGDSSHLSSLVNLRAF